MEIRAVGEISVFGMGQKHGTEDGTDKGKT